MKPGARDQLVYLALVCFLLGIGVGIAFGLLRGVV